MRRDTASVWHTELRTARTGARNRSPRIAHNSHSRRARYVHEVPGGDRWVPIAAMGTRMTNSGVSAGHTSSLGSRLLTALRFRNAMSSAVWSWQLRANCRGLPSVVFYPPDGERGNQRSRREHRAKRICGDCPVSTECLMHAITWPEPYGIWAGTTPAERGQVPARRKAQDGLQLQSITEPVGSDETVSLEQK